MSTARKSIKTSRSYYPTDDDVEHIITPVDIKTEIFDDVPTHAPPMVPRMIDDPEIVISNKGGPKLIHKGYMYTLHKRQPNSIRWRCVLRSHQCRGSLITNRECKKPYVRMCHSHHPDYAAAEVARQKCKAFGEPLSQFFNPDGTLITPPVNKPSTNTPKYTKTIVNDLTIVMSEFGKREHDQPQAAKALRLATQNLVRQMRQIAPAPIAQSSPQQTQQQQTSQQPTKTLVLKTIPLKVKQISPTAIKMQQARQNLQPGQPGVPQSISAHQPPTEVCLRWNSYHSNMQHSFPSLLDNEQFVDVTLACEGRSLKCHKMILSSCSDYLAQLLRENPCQHPIILMKDLKFWEVEALVKFMYRGEVNVTHDKLPQLLNAAEALQVKGLAGPSGSQHPKPPLLIPQTRKIVPQQIITRVANETKDNKPSTSTSNNTPSSTTATTSTPAPNVASPKRGIKRRPIPSEVPEARPFTKIRLQRPVSPQSKGQSSPMVKVEPLDIPLSPGGGIYADEHRDEEDSSSNTQQFESIIGLHEDDDPGGDIELADELDHNDDSNQYSEDQMEFVPTDFLEQEQDITDDPEDQTNCDSIQLTDDDSKHNNEEEEEEEEEDDDDDEEEDEGEEKSEEESRPDRTKKDKT
ncbi:protein jim lovell isoform X2 [Nasonia vitripennis]|uniref:BTB domain-containing protein n=1 Tax=Nasonia vitripennis TaxID=7425 RepID=A0A7M7PY02_NASVI|nr:protein jim lovell isoform X2 [Nasonia vitripennis]